MSRHTHREITPTRDDDAQPEMTDRYRTMLINDINRVVDDHAPRRYLLSLVHAAYAADNIPIQLIEGRHVTCRDTGVDPGRFSLDGTLSPARPPPVSASTTFSADGPEPSSTATPIYRKEKMTECQFDIALPTSVQCVVASGS